MTLSRRMFVAGALAASSVGVLPSQGLSDPETTPASGRHGFGWVRDRPNPREITRRASAATVAFLELYPQPDQAETARSAE